MNTFISKIPLTIFDNQELKSKVDNLFYDMNDAIHERIMQNLKIINPKTTNELLVKNINKSFKIYFFESVLDEISKNTLNETNKCNILKSIEPLISRENLTNALMGRPLLKAFLKSLNEIPGYNIYNNKSLTVKRAYLEMKILSNKKYNILKKSWNHNGYSFLLL